MPHAGTMPNGRLCRTGRRLSTFCLLRSVRGVESFGITAGLVEAALHRSVWRGVGNGRSLSCSGGGAVGAVSGWFLGGAGRAWLRDVDCGDARAGNGWGEPLDARGGAGGVGVDGRAVERFVGGRARRGLVSLVSPREIAVLLGYLRERGVVRE